MWYKFYADCGPGHQSHEEDYEYLHEEPSEEMLDQYWHDWVENSSWMRYSDCVGKIEKVDKIPTKVLLEKYEEAKVELDNARGWLRTLEIELGMIEDG